jgi:hypothetical protein
MKEHWQWSSVPYKGRRLYSIGINDDGSLYNPNNYPEEDARTAALGADERKKEKLIEARKQGVVTRQRRREQRIAKIAKAYLLGHHVGNLRQCAMCERTLSDPVSIERGIGSECWPHLMERLAAAVPRCEQEIAGCKKALAEMELQDFAYFEARNRRYGEYGLRMADREYQRHLDNIKSRKRQLADAEILLEAARRWRPPPEATHRAHGQGALTAQPVANPQTLQPC